MFKQSQGVETAMWTLNLIVTLAKDNGERDPVTAGETGRGDALSPLQKDLRDRAFIGGTESHHPLKG